MSRPTAADRRATGRQARDRAPRRQLGRWDESARGQDALAVLAGQNEQRLPELASLRFGRMALSPWNYYRGAAAVMAADLAAAPHTDLEVQLCGDAHVLNFGLWATPERSLSFDLRDFDETLQGPFEWDVLRFVASLVVLARENGLPPSVSERAVRAAVRRYCDGMAGYAGAHELEIWYDLFTIDDLLGLFEAEDRERLSDHVGRRAAKRTSAGAFRKLTTTVDGRRRILEDPPRRVRENDDEHAELVAKVVARYRATLREDRQVLLDRFEIVDWVRQVVGVGSVGMHVYLALLDGRGGDDPLFLQLKQAGPSVYEPYLAASPFPNHGQRVVEGRHLIQSATDIFNGWTTVGEMDFYVRQFRDMKVIPDSERIAPHLVPFATKCGAVLARAHARSGDAVAIASYLGAGRAFEEAMVAAAEGYADQTERDHGQLVAAIEDGTVAGTLE